MRRLLSTLLFALLLAAAGSPLLAQDSAAEACPATRQLTEEAALFASIRLFDGVDPADFPEINHYSENEFLPLLKEAPGYRFYATRNNSEAGSGAAVNVFTSEAEMQAANALAIEHIADNLSALLPNPPEIFGGPVQLLLYANHCPEMSEGAADTAEATDSSEDQPAAFLGIRVYASADGDADLDAINTLIRERFAPIISAAEGFILYLTYLIVDAEGEETGMVTLNLFASEEEMIAANRQAAEFVATELSDLAAGPPTVYGGAIAVLDLSGLFADDTMGDDAGAAADSEDSAEE